MSDKTVVLAGYKRSPFDYAQKGQLARTRPDDLAAEVVKALVKDSQIDPDAIEDLILGCAFPEGEQGFNLARIVAVLSELPVTVGGITVNRWCGSSMSAIHFAAGQILAGAGEAYICAGVESMSRIPMGGFNPSPHPGLVERFPEIYMSMGETAENLARERDVSREDQEKFALNSHLKAAKARDNGLFKDEIVPVAGVDTDGCIRGDTSLDALGGLKPAFDQNGSVTAGTSSPLTDGASAVLVASESFAKSQGLSILGRIRGIGVSGCQPRIMGVGPVPASQKALERAGCKMSDMDIIELNEAFGAQSLAVVRELGLDEAKLNLDGGAIALGHPLGASGARITGKLASLLKREGKSLGLATMCVGMGQGTSIVLEKDA